MEQNIKKANLKPEKTAFLLPYLLTLSLIVADQLTKAWIVGNVAENTIASRHMGDFLWIVHMRNLGIAFSIGDSISNLLRVALFIVVPGCFLAAAAIFSFVSKTLTLFQRYAISIIIGGGVGNLIDRIFRPEGVVDFISFSLFGIFGLERFPTFNIADMSITIGAALLILSGFLMDGKEAVDE
ncbi:MAG: signal peptidase II [Spirochaetae bacterium HGW-Spirochaetae-9]|nr:MAG: signal peptidase II [Spirochaetae bacterium HGW-Spirochaetae-9]